MISRAEAIDIIKQVPLYRYECELDKGRQSDLFQALNKAISDMQEKIEKEDVCEWKLFDVEANAYDSTCGGAFWFGEGDTKDNGFNYCPYCGKKIKVVESI